MTFPLDTERCTIREFVAPDDVAAVQGYAADPQVVRFMPWGPNSDAETVEYLERCAGYRAVDPRVNYEMAIVRRADGQLIGGAGLRIIRPDAGEGEIGYVLRRDCWGQGYMPEVVHGLLRVGFQGFALHRISALTDPQNVASGRVLEKCGFRLEGCLRDHAKTKGEWRNSLVYGLLEGEWRASTNGASTAAVP